MPHVFVFRRFYSCCCRSIFHTKLLRSDSYKLIRFNASWQAVIGLEIHAQIAADTKLFSSSNTQYTAPVNTQVSYFDSAQPGTLPVLNKTCVEAAVKAGLALSCHINEVCSFDRKHYFYADLPQGYQITQQREPIAVNGKLSYPYNKNDKTVITKEATIKQIQLEQDSGKSVHDVIENHSLIDLNRAGIGLMEIVTEPDFTSGKEATAFVKELQLVLQRIGSSRCKAEEGGFRVDANISVHKPGQPLGVRSEVKNINGFRYVGKAIDFEISRQISDLHAGREVINETRSFNYVTGETIPMRDKERLQDYRFMPEPNLPPLRLSNNTATDSDQVIDLNEIKNSMPELPAATRLRLQNDYGLTLRQALIVVNEDGGVEYVDAMLKGREAAGETAVNFMLFNLFNLLNATKSTLLECPVKPEQLGEIIDMMRTDFISRIVGVKVLEIIFNDPTISSREYIEDNKLTKMNDLFEIKPFCDKVVAENKKLVKSVKSDDDRAFHKLVSLVINMTNGRANPHAVVKLLSAKLHDWEKWEDFDEHEEP